jgi:hypothetical protein
MVKDRIYNLIKTLLLKADIKYNDNRNERIECLKKARQLAKKSDWYFRFENDFKRLNEQLEEEISTDKSTNNSPYELFVDEFQENYQGNLIFKKWLNNKLLVITIVKCSNGHYGVISTYTQMQFFNDLYSAYEYTFRIYKERVKYV